VALEYLDARTETGVQGYCPLPELFAALRERLPSLTLPDFQDGVKRLHEMRALRLQPASEMAEPEYAVLVDDQLMYSAAR
jgi:hypothetical protein